MSMLEYLEKKKKKVLSELVSAALPERAVKVMESEMDRLLYQYNESEEEERLRSAASAMTETAKVSLAYLTSMGEPKIWERYEDDDPDAPTKKPVPVIAWILLLGTLALAAAAVIFLLRALKGRRLSSAGKTQAVFVRRKSRFSEMLKTLLRRIAKTVRFEAAYRKNRHTPEGLYVYTVRKMRGPSVTALAPAASRGSMSSGLMPPSGPMTMARSVISGVISCRRLPSRASSQGTSAS